MKKSNLNPVFQNILDSQLSIHSVTNSTREIEKIVGGWKNTSKYPCPECGKKLGMPEYKCDKCNLKLKIKVQF